MTPSPDLWPWLALVGLGLFHGLNPAMGWLFAVALGLHRRSRSAVLVSLAPIAFGHAASVAVVLAVLAALGTLLDLAALAPAAGTILLGWAAWHALYGHRRRVRIGMQTGLAGLALWSFLMAGAHGAGLMLVPVVLPMCVSGSPGGSAGLAFAALGLHTLAMLTAIAAVSLIVYDRVGLAFLRRGWVNLDLVWTVALGFSGALLLLA